MFYMTAVLAVHDYLTLVGMYTSLDLSPIDPRLAGASLTISSTATLIFGTLTQEPERYRDRTRLYNEAVAEKLKEIGGETFEGNVIGVGRSILGRFFSTHMFQAVNEIILRDQVDLHELRVLPGTMQAEATTRRASESDATSRHDGHKSAASLIWSTLMTQKWSLVLSMSVHYLNSRCILTDSSILYTIREIYGLPTLLVLGTDPINFR